MHSSTLVCQKEKLPTYAGKYRRKHFIINIVRSNFNFNFESKEEIIGEVNIFLKNLKYIFEVILIKENLKIQKSKEKKIRLLIIPSPK